MIHLATKRRTLMAILDYKKCDVAWDEGERA
jgi:hypothetical protein